MHLLDTNACIRYLNDGNSYVTRKIKAVLPKSIALCDIVGMELYYGAYRSMRQQENLEILRQLLTTFHSFPFDAASAEICGRLRAMLATTGTPIGPYDLQIAAIALANNLTLVTHNTREFSRVPGLVLEDWEI